MDWDHIKSWVGEYVQMHKRWLAENDYPLPAWNEQAIACEAVRIARQRVEAGEVEDSAAGAYAAALEAANREMAGSLRWDEIRKEIQLWAAKRLPQEAEDIAAKAVEEAWECWVPQKERNWQRPGRALAFLIARRIAADDNGQNIPLPPDDNLTDYREHDPADLRELGLDEDINAVLRTWPAWKAAAFVAHWVYGVPAETCWVMCQQVERIEGNANALRNRFYREMEPLKRALEKDLRRKGHLP